MKKAKQEEIRSMKQVIEHYEIEKELARKLKNASKIERRNLYTKLYDELFRRVPHHPQISRKSDPELKRKNVIEHKKLLSRYFSQDSNFMEIGPGDCALSIELCKYFKRVYAIDISTEITNNLQKPINFELIISDGTSVDVEPGTITVAFSNQLMEHLHPDDAVEQLENIYRALIPGGNYICLTPHRFMGPADISRDFDDIATGFHLKEYTNMELFRLFKSVGFSKIKSFINNNEKYFLIPIYPKLMVESLINPFPHFLRKKISKMFLIRKLLRIQLIATK